MTLSVDSPTWAWESRGQALAEWLMAQHGTRVLPQLVRRERGWLAVLCVSDTGGREQVHVLYLGDEDLVSEAGEGAPEITPELLTACARGVEIFREDLPALLRSLAWLSSLGVEGPPWSQEG